MTDATPESSLNDLVGKTVAERYQVERLLGSGGMGSVYLAEHVHMRKAVALKVLHRELTVHREIVARFQREAIAVGRIEHPNVAAATDFGTLENGSFYLVLEYIDGPTLRALLEAGALPIERALEISWQTASALDAAHAAGIVHRDLKPDNIMLVVQPGAPDRVKVLDFGIAKLTIPEDVLATAAPDPKQLTRSGVVMGTPAYIAPEQAVGDSVDARTDLYALGVILYEMIAGRVPFEGASTTEVLTKQLTEAPPALPAGTPAEVSQLVEQLLRKLPAERPESAGAVLERLEELLGQPHTLAAVTTTEQAPAAVSEAATTRGVSEPDPKRRPVTALAAAAGVLLAVTAFFAFRTSGEDAPAGATGPGAASAAPSALATTRDDGARTRRADAPAVPASGVTPVADAQSASAPSPKSPSSSVQTESSSRTVTTSRDGNSVTTTTTTKRSKTTERRSSTKNTKRRTGPGGIYIPPPSEWF